MYDDRLAPPRRGRRRSEYGSPDKPEGHHRESDEEHHQSVQRALGWPHCVVLGDVTGFCRRHVFAHSTRWTRDTSPRSRESRLRPGGLVRFVPTARSRYRSPSTEPGEAPLPPSPALLREQRPQRVGARDRRRSDTASPRGAIRVRGITDFDRYLRRRGRSRPRRDS